MKHKDDEDKTLADTVEGMYMYQNYQGKNFAFIYANFMVKPSMVNSNTVVYKPEKVSVCPSIFLAC